MPLCVKDASGQDIEPGDKLLYISDGRFVTATVNEVRFRKGAFELKVRVRGTKTRYLHTGDPYEHRIDYPATLRRTSSVFKVGPNGITITQEALMGMAIT